MTRKICLLGLCFIGSLLPQTVFAQSVTLDPGLYSYSNIINIAGSTMPDDKGEYCVRAGENSRTLDEIVESLSGGAKCTLNNVSMTATHGQANLFCRDTSLGMEISGVLKAEFSSTSYDVDTNGIIGGFLPLQTQTKIRRIGVCPAENLEAHEPNPT